tara:strand:+ start:2330 stop:2536 length:207 start_codon:yes stop_codon:yes gene_type:complete
MNINTLMAYESGELNDVETINFFADLVKTRMAWSLQGSYNRMAEAMITAGFITPDGELTELANETFNN